MPPIANHRLAPVNGRLIKSVDARVFDKHIDYYIMRHWKDISNYRHLVQDWIKQNQVLKLEINFVWHKNKVICKDGKIKKMDLDGRIKSAIDGLSDVLQFDDKLLIEIHAFKSISNNQHDEHYDITLQPGELKHYE